MSDVVICKLDEEVAVATLNRPEQFNALNLELAEKFSSLMLDLSTDKNVRAIIITGSGKAFCAGGDLKWTLSYSRGAGPALHELAGKFHMGVQEIRRMKKPVIAGINGVAAGAGFSLALACDFRVMAKTALLKQAYTSSGLSLDGGGTFTLPRLVGLARAMEIVAFDKPISAEQALSWGLVTKIVDDDVLAESLKMAHELALGSLNSFGMCKRLLTDSFETSFEAQLERERKGIARSAMHSDGQEGIKAFVEKRKPVFFNRKSK